ncbi:MULTISPECIES: hypothetical protein [unclassified Mesorhizobium]|uniref:hypothetical protein n=1 Tax=unclassified Mesorhizobium TaxID=325217 RepID=UPI0003D0111F|nr:MULTISPECIES: hypothetical protein [unclassified Mesorhizobium]ESZ06476.1 hypothetical protein X736_10955 [Mesorhizobium sp. L2C089B000]WJI52558.1 hypothetical protein NLY44_07780 [Mesorhizobium sp. C089B]
MTIDERRAREKSEKENPWRPVREAVEDGMICEMRLSNLTTLGFQRFFRHLGRWYRIDPPSLMANYWDVMEYRPIGIKLSKHRMANAIWLAEEGGAYEYRGGKFLPKPKPYKNYWRAPDKEGDE